ncbi:carbon-nitrogen hydrolase family protein [Kineococcus rubinsiae]|uniref:carbon-nitrogen hydrolase family protein n=1 Tax=Kineococcus rubinsiae TaxID=2609562 RepID=UPI001431DAD7|nr:carbon-nitrogen hydrolase family protein [Kineococcus rubinsiae]NIZ90121.1 carbon-nitrogen hydrolase family protein [Kineococcus rubinsiae]
MRIALGQTISTTDPRANLDLVAAEVARARDAGARLLVLPEAMICRFGVPLGPVAEPVDGPWASAVERLADDAGLTVVAGSFTPAGDRVRNTLVAVGAGVRAHYDKVHLYDAFGFEESRTVEAGTEPVVLDVDGVGVGLATCYDVRFPGLFQALADRGAQVVALAASWGAGPRKVEQWDLLTAARALDSTCFVAACGQADPATRGEEPTGAPTGVGHSRVVGPLGQVVAELGAEVGTLVVDLDLTEVAAARASLPVLADRRF